MKKRWKCGGEGGTPGPCPDPSNQGASGGADSGGKPSEEQVGAADKPKPEKPAADEASEVGEEYATAAKDNDASQESMSIQDVAKMQDWHGQLIADRGGKKGEPLLPNDPAGSTKFMSSLLNPDMAGGLKQMLYDLDTGYDPNTTNLEEQIKPGEGLSGKLLEHIQKLSPKMPPDQQRMAAWIGTQLENPEQILQGLQANRKKSKWLYVGNGRFKRKKTW